MVRTLLLIGLGGGLGSIFRYLLSVYLSRTFPSAFPYGTFAVNIIGCFLIGLFFGLFERHPWITEEWRLFLTVGFCGGFTTFSAFAVENMRLLQTGDYTGFILYTVASVGMGVAAVFMGLYVLKI